MQKAVYRVYCHELEPTAWSKSAFKKQQNASVAGLLVTNMPKRDPFITLDKPSSRQVLSVELETTSIRHDLYNVLNTQRNGASITSKEDNPKMSSSDGI